MWTSSRFRSLPFSFAQGSWSLYKWSQSFLFFFNPGAFFFNYWWLKHLSTCRDAPCNTTVNSNFKFPVTKISQTSNHRKRYHTWNYIRYLIIDPLKTVFIQIISAFFSRVKTKSVLCCRLVCQVFKGEGVVDRGLLLPNA